MRKLKRIYWETTKEKEIKGAYQISEDYIIEYIIFNNTSVHRMKTLIVCENYRCDHVSGDESEIKLQQHAERDLDRRIKLYNMNNDSYEINIWFHEYKHKHK